MNRLTRSRSDDIVEYGCNNAYYDKVKMMKKERQRWQPEEDALLEDYVRLYGPKEWALVSQRMCKPLDRDAKSCLERWKNYLKPGLKKGPLTLEEQTLIVSLQAKYGNKWKKIASQIPGRTAKRLGKWWEVFREKQLKRKKPQITATTATYDHILETFAEKHVNVHHRVPNPPSTLSVCACSPLVDQMGAILQYCKEVEECWESWLSNKREATWRLSRLEKQLECEKARKRREKMEEVEEKIRCLREEELGFVCRIEREYRERLCEFEREEEAKEVRIAQIWFGKFCKLGMTVERIVGARLFHAISM